MSEPREDTAPPSAAAALMARRFRGYLPVAIDVETGGFHPATDALLEIAAVLIDMDSDGALKRGATHNFHVQPFAGGRLDPTSLSITSSAEALLGVIAGGSGTLGGPVIGATLVLLLKNYVSAYVERWNMLLGLVFLFIVLVMPTGITPGLHKLAARLRGGSR